MHLTQKRIDEINGMEIESDDMEMPYMYIKAPDLYGREYILRVDIKWVCLADAVTAFKKIGINHKNEDVLDIHVSRKTLQIDRRGTEVMFSILIAGAQEETFCGIADK